MAIPVFTLQSPQHIIKKFADDDDSEVNKVEVEFLKQQSLSSDVTKWTWRPKIFSKKSTTEVVDVHFIFYGPVKPDYDKGVLKFPDSRMANHLANICKF